MKRAEISKADSVIREIKDQMSIDSAVHESVVNRLKTRIRTLTSNLPVLEPISPHEDTVCDRFISSTLKKDTIIATQDTLIHKLEDRATELVGYFRAILSQKDTVINVQTEIAGMWEGQANNFEKAFRKADKQASRRWALNVGAGYGVSESGLSPHVGLTLGYNLIRFKFKK